MPNLFFRIPLFLFPTSDVYPLIPFLSQMKDRVKKFEKFIDETEAKRRRAIHKYQTELKLKEQKESELDQLVTQLDELKDR